MAVAAPCSLRVAGLRSFRLCSAHAQRLADFYEAAFDFRRLGVEELSDAQTQALTGIGGRMLRITLALGAQRVELLQFIDQPGRPYPADSSASDLVFQHFALVVSDMTAAMQRLSAQRGWTPISIDGPQRLPAGSGGVTAFKFRDPEGHPLELLAFQTDKVPTQWQQVATDSPFVGIDHSAISVANVAHSVAFYESLGLAVSNRSVNNDPAQARLDGLEHPVVDVIAMNAEQSTSHLELLCYRSRCNDDRLQLNANDVAATCLVFESGQQAKHEGTRRMPRQNRVDPDGHHFSIISPVT